MELSDQRIIRGVTMESTPIPRSLVSKVLSMAGKSLEIIFVAALSMVWAIPERAAASTLSFSIELQFDTSVDSTVREAFETGASAWESQIVGYQNTLTNDSVVIFARVTSLDGVGGVLGSAQLTETKFESFSAGFVYASTASVTLDRDDVGRLATTEILSDLVMHELGHAIGIGTLWYTPGFQELATPGSGRFTGAAALEAYRDEFDPFAEYVPVELDGGPGTADLHWDESTFGNELMTGFLDGPTRLSSVTLGSLEDIGYVTAVPEPAIGLSTFGLVAFVVLGRSRRRARA